MEENFESIIKYVAIGISTIITYFLTPLKSWVNYQLPKLLPSILMGQKQKMLLKILKINDILYAIESLDCVCRVSLIETKNGGGVPRAGGEVRGSIIMPHKWSKHLNNEILDSDMALIVLNTIANKQYSFNISSLRGDGFTKHFLGVNKTRSCLSFEIKESRKKYSFVLVEFKTPMDDVSTLSKENIRIKIGMIKEEIE